jgi:hypothetical protein
MIGLLTGVGRVEITDDLLSKYFQCSRVTFLLFASINSKLQNSQKNNGKLRIEREGKKSPTPYGHELRKHSTGTLTARPGASVLSAEFFNNYKNRLRKRERIHLI